MVLQLHDELEKSNHSLERSNSRDHAPAHTKQCPMNWILRRPATCRVLCNQPWIITLACLVMGLTAVLPGQAAPGDLLWSKPIAAEYTGDAALGADGTIYVGAVSTTVFTALNPDGTTRWTFDLGTMGASLGVRFPLVGADGAVYAMSYDGHLVVLEADGVLRWHRQFPQSVWMPPVVGSDGSVYVSSRRPYLSDQSSQLVALQADGTLRWEIPMWESTPTLAVDGTILLASQSQFLVALRADGTTRWWSEGAGWFHPVALGANERIYTGAGPNLESFGLDGQRLWSVSVGVELATGPVLSGDGQLFAVTYEPRLWALNTSGNVLWEYELPAEGASTPAVSAGGHLYLGSGPQMLALSTSGALAWVVETESSLMSSPVLAPDGTIYIGGSDGYLYAFEGDGTGPVTGPWGMLGGDARRSYSRQEPVQVPGTPSDVEASDNTHLDKVLVTWTSAPHAQTHEIWRHDVDDPAGARRIIAGLGGVASYADLSAVPGATHYYWVRGMSSAGAGPLSVSAAGRRGVAAVGEVMWRFPSDSYHGQPPAIGEDGRRYLLHHRNQAVAYDTDGTLLWTFDAGPRTDWAGPPVIDNDGNVLLAFNQQTGPNLALIRGQLVCRTPEGLDRWRIEFDTPLSGTLALGKDGTILIPTLEDQSIAQPGTAGLHGLDADGQPLWFLRVPGGMGPYPCVQADGTVFGLGLDGFLYAVASDGTLRWRVHTGVTMGMLTLGADSKIYLGRDTEFMALNQDGTRAWVFNDPAVHFRSPVLATDGTVLMGVTDGRLLALRPNGTKRWERLAGVWTGAMAEQDRFHFPHSNYLSVFSIHGDEVAHHSFLPRIVTPVVIGPDAVAYFGMTDGYVYGMRTTGGPAPSAWPLLHGDPQHRRRTEVPLGLPAFAPLVVASQGTHVTGVRLTWVPAPPAQSYEIWRSLTPELTEASVVVNGFGGTNVFHDRNVMPETPYYYWVKAVNSAGASQLSAPVQGYRAQPQPGNLLDLWTFDGAGSGAPAMGPDGTVYVPVYRGSKNSPRWRLAALKPDGSIGWEYETGYGSITATPVVGRDGTVYIGSVDFGSPELVLHAIRPDGELRWKYDAGAWITTGVAITSDDQVIVACQDGTVHAVAPDGSLVWKHTLDHPIHAAPVIGQDGAIYVLARQANMFAPANLVALHPDGTIRWTMTFPNHGDTDLRDSPAIGPDGAIYVGSRDGQVLAVNLDGTVRWSATVGSVTRGSPVLDTGAAVYTGSPWLPPQPFAALSPDGSTRWSYAPGGAVWGGAAIGADGHAYVAATDGTVYALGPNGDLAWEVATLTEFRASPLLTPDGTLYVVSLSGRIYSFHTPAGPAADAWSLVGQNPAREGRMDGNLPPVSVPTGLEASLDTFNDRVEVTWGSAPGAWYYDVWRGLSGDWTAALRVGTGLSATTRFVDHDVETDVTYFYWIMAGNSDQVSAALGPVEGRRRPIIPGETLYTYVSADPNLGQDAHVVSREGVVVITEPSLNRLVALNPDLTLRWEQAVTNLVGGLVAVGLDGRVFSVAGFGHLDCFNADGAHLWRFSTNQVALRQPAVRSDGVVIVPSDARWMVALNPDGKLRWQAALPDPLVVGSGPAITVDGIVVVACIQGRLVALDRDGQVLWVRRMSGLRGGPVISSDGNIYQLNNADGLAALDAVTGQVLWISQAFNGANGTVAIGPDNTVYALNSQGRLAARRPDGSSVTWFLASGLTSPPAVAANGDLYFASTDGFLRAWSPEREEWVWHLDSRDITGGARRSVRNPLIGTDGTIYAQVDTSLIAGVMAAGGRTDAYWPTRRGDGSGAGQALRWLQPPRILESAPFFDGMDLSLQAEARLLVGAPKQLEYWADDQLVGVSPEISGNIVWADVPPGRSNLRVEVTDADDNRFVSLPTTIWVHGPTVTAVDGPAGLQLSIPTRHDWSYTVWSSSDLRTWQRHEPSLQGNGQIQTWIEPWPAQPGPSARYYHVELQPGEAPPDEFFQPEGE
jgi:outer membrane protein assembly factor BamB